MHPIDLVSTKASKFKFCNKCETMKPPEGGLDMGHKWMCQSCWLKRTTGMHLKQNQLKNA
jgi:hypothetical protein